MRASRVTTTPERVDNNKGLTLLDTDPDPDCLDFDIDIDIDDLDSDYSVEGGIRLEDTDTETIPGRGSNGHHNVNDYEFWESFDHLDTPITSPPTPLSLSTYDFDYPDNTSPLTEEAIVYTPEGGYEHLFKFDLKRYSFPSRQLRVAKNVYTKGEGEVGSGFGFGGDIRAAGDYNGKEVGSGIVDKSDRDEIERFKRELRSYLPLGPTPTSAAKPTPTSTPTPPRATKRKERPVTVTAPVSSQQDSADTVDETRIIPDLLWEEPDKPSTCLLDLDLGDMDPANTSASGARGGYKWKGPIRDIETGRPITPYRDDPSSNPASASSSQATRPIPRQTARRGRPFPSGPSRESRPRQDHHDGEGEREGRGDSNASESRSSKERRLGGSKVEHKSSTRSLPSQARKGRQDGSHHHSSNSFAPPIPPSQSTTATATSSRQKKPISTSTSSKRPDPTSPYALLLSKPQARRSIPTSLYNNASPLQRSMLSNWSSSCADKDYQNGILDLLEWLTRSINLQFSRGGSRADGGRFKVDVFGSVSWGGETGTSGDLDMVVIVCPTYLLQLPTQSQY